MVQAETTQLPYLDTFSKAAELSSFTAAARALRMTQAAVSQRVQALEKELGKPLFKRQGGRVLLTAAGERLYDYAQRILQIHREARRDIGGCETAVIGELSLAASSIPGEHLLPALLSVFCQKHPHIRIHAQVADSQSVLGQVERGEVSVGLVGWRADKAHFDFRHLARDRMALAVPAGHLLSKRRKVSVKQVAGLPLVLRAPGSGQRHFLDVALAQLGLSLVDFQVVLELGSNEAVKEAVLHGMGATILSAAAMHKEIAAGQLRALQIGDLARDRDLFVVRDRRRVVPLPARVFLNFLDTHSVGDLLP